MANAIWILIAVGLIGVLIAAVKLYRDGALTIDKDKAAESVKDVVEDVKKSFDRK